MFEYDLSISEVLLDRSIELSMEFSSKVDDNMRYHGKELEND